MSERSAHDNFNPDPDSWSKYQLMVLQQLNDHNKVLQNLNKEIIAINQSIAVNKAESEMWRNQTTINLSELRNEVDKLIRNEKGLDQRIVSMEKDILFEEKSDVKSKATWAFIVSVVAVVANVLAQFIIAYIKTK